MCLSRVTTVHEKPKLMQFYKVMRRVRRKGKPNLYHFQYRSSIRPLIKDKLRHASRGWIFGFNGSYKAGFHGYTNLKAAAREISSYPEFNKFIGLPGRYVVVLCEGLVRTEGIEYSSKIRVVVADTLTILKEIPAAKIRKVKGLKPLKKKTVKK